MGPTSTLVDSQQNFKRIHPSCRYNLQFSFFLPHTRVAKRRSMRRIGSPPDLGEVILVVSLSARSHVTWPHSVCPL